MGHLRWLKRWTRESIKARMTVAHEVHKEASALQWIVDIGRAGGTERRDERRNHIARRLANGKGTLEDDLAFAKSSTEV